MLITEPVWMPPSVIGPPAEVTPRLPLPPVTPRMPCVPACGWLHACRSRNKGSSTTRLSAGVSRRSRDGWSVWVGRSTGISASCRLFACPRNRVSLPCAFPFARAGVRSSRDASVSSPSSTTKSPVSPCSNSECPAKRPCDCSDFVPDCLPVTTVSRKSRATTRASAFVAASSHTSFCFRYQCASIPLGRRVVTVCPCGGNFSSSATSSREFLHIIFCNTSKKYSRLCKWFFSNGASQNFLNHVFSVNGEGALRNANKPNKSSTPFETGVPVTHHRCFPGSNAAICAHAAVDDSTSCASSKTTLHQKSRVNGVGITSYFFLWREERAFGD
mmetsp:Transcript_4392/g.16262  ORF Transcript_4392/g.16262 Transcript_4392/m.16262 type:complete len:330 (+) Transcript_4392:2636-3625(+)